MDQTYMKRQPVLRLLLSMSLPMMLSMLVNSLYNIVDSYFVAKISEDAMTALSLVYPMQNLIGAVAIGFGVGINAVISIYMGMQDHKRADQAATTGTVLAVFHGIFFTIFGIGLMPAFLRLFHASESTFLLGIRYTRIVFLFTVIQMLTLVFEKIFQAVGAMKTAMISMLIGCISNMILDPIMIFGIGPFPAMGIEGAALATGLGQAVTLAIYLLIYLRRPLNVRLRREYLVPQKEMVVRLYSVGIPASLSTALPSLQVTVLNSILAAYSESYVLVLGIYYKLQTFLYLPASGLIQGMRPLIGYNYGAKEMKRVSSIFRISLMICVGIMAVGTVLCLTVPGSLMGMFTSNPETIRLGEEALRVISAGFLCSAVSVTAAGALEGIGKGAPSLIISCSRYAVLMLPAAFVMSRIFGAVGVWWSFGLTEAVTAVISGIVYYRAVKH